MQHKRIVNFFIENIFSQKKDCFVEPNLFCLFLRNNLNYDNGLAISNSHFSSLINPRQAIFSKCVNDVILFHKCVMLLDRIGLTFVK
jgi:hypothetical protein